jgi:protein-S-isoprenylcysteine O-methyltransferase Ste14
MNIETYSPHFIAVIYGLMVVIRLIYGSLANRKGGKAVRRKEPGWSPILISILMILANGALLLAILWPELLRSTDVPLSAGWRWLGLVLGLGMDALFIWIHQALGQNWAVGVLVKEKHRLVTSGPYRWVRHPMYLAIFGFSVAFFLLSANVLVGLFWAALTIASAWRVGEEERLLTEAFGDEYRKYMARTGRFLPKWLGKS